MKMLLEMDERIVFVILLTLVSCDVEGRITTSTPEVTSSPITLQPAAPEETILLYAIMALSGATLLAMTGALIYFCYKHRQSACLASAKDHLTEVVTEKPAAPLDPSLYILQVSKNIKITAIQRPELTTLEERSPFIISVEEYLRSDTIHEPDMVEMTSKTEPSIYIISLDEHLRDDAGQEPVAPEPPTPITLPSALMRHLQCVDDVRRIEVPVPSEDSDDEKGEEKYRDFW